MYAACALDIVLRDLAPTELYKLTTPAIPIRIVFVQEDGVVYLVCAFCATAMNSFSLFSH